MADRRILTLNGGSSSIKFALYDGELSRTLVGEVERAGTPEAAISARDGAGTKIAVELGEGSHSSADRLLRWLDGQMQGEMKGGQLDGARQERGQSGGGQLAGAQRESGRREGGQLPGAQSAAAQVASTELAGAQTADVQSVTVQLVGVGHRVVHGGASLTEHAVVTAGVLEALRKAVPLDPSHLPREIALMEAVSRWRPEVRQVACFDTAFHRGLPKVATLMPIPRRFSEAGVRRLGFHGLSYTFLMQELARVAPAESRGKVILAHLGSGASMAAVSGGQPVETTMGFTPLGGIVMGTRPGDLDPGVVTHMARTEKLDADGLDRLLSTECGLAGLSGGRSDVRDLLAARATDAQAREALEVFCYQARKMIGALAAAMGGVETLIFAGGIGEHAWQMREEICAGLGFLGIGVDGGRNEASAAVISEEGARVTVRVIRTNEELVIAQTVRGFL